MINQTTGTSILEAEAKRHAASGAIIAAKIMSLLPNGEGGYQVTLGLRDGDGIQPVIVGSARERVRRFGSVDSATRFLRSLGGEFDIRVV